MGKVRVERANINIPLPATMRDQLRDISDDIGLSVSVIARNLMGQFIKKYKAGKVNDVVL